jgi:hypothetical protein
VWSPEAPLPLAIEISVQVGRAGTEVRELDALRRLDDDPVVAAVDEPAADATRQRGVRVGAAEAADRDAGREVLDSVGRSRGRGC